MLEIKSTASVWKIICGVKNPQILATELKDTNPDKKREKLVGNLIRGVEISRVGKKGGGKNQWNLAKSQSSWESAETSRRKPCEN